MELTEREILILRGLAESPALDVSGGLVDEHVDALIDVGYVSLRTADNLFSYEITEAGRAALKQSDGGG